MRTLLATSASDSVIAGLGSAGGTAGYTQNLTLVAIVANVVNVALSLSGIACVIILVYAGFLYLTAGGKDDNVKKAKSLMTNSVIGIVIVVGAYAIAKFVFAALSTVVSV